jgi:anti-anti-sigma factor
VSVEAGTRESDCNVGTRVEIDESSKACVVRLDGELDLSVVPELRGSLSEIIKTGCAHVVLDLEHVGYVDSTALGLLVWLDRQLEPCEGRLVLTGANPDVARILELSGLVGVAPTIGARESVEDALSGLEPSDTTSALRWSESMVLPAQVESLADVRTAVCDLLSAVKLSDASLFDVKVAIGEALANAVRHGSPGGESDQVRIDLEVYEDRIVVRVRDRGTGYQELAGTPTAGDDLFASGGRGVVFMRALMDHVDFAEDPSTGGTMVSLEKKLPVRHVTGESDQDL